MSKHSPTPWISDYQPENSPHIWIEDACGMPLACFEPCDQADGTAEEIKEIISDQDHADAAFIVRAVNAHDELVALLRNDVLPVVMNYKAIHDKPGCICMICSLPDMIRAALAKADAP